MKINANCVLVGARSVLVPYESKHVERYHQWMMSPELQELTASEPLSIEEEYEMQRSWREDDDKCTFIVLDTTKLQETSSELDSMAGDVNLFFNDQDDRHCAEVEVMVAEPSCRGRGIGKEAVYLMMSYSLSHLGVSTFTAKIGMANTASLALFAKLGFSEVSRSEVFQEVTLRLAVTPDVQHTIVQATSHMTTQLYSDWMRTLSRGKDMEV